MFELLVVLMWSIIAASVVDLPVPVEPVTSTMPWCRSQNLCRIGGRPRLSKLGTTLGMLRNVAPTPVALWNTFTRKRPPSLLT